MFDKKVQGEALILDDEGAGNVTDTDFHGVDWDHHKYIVEVRPAGGEPFRVTGSRQSGNETVVTSEILRPGGAPIQVDWFLIDQGGRNLITDVYVGGVSMKVTQRDEFASVIQRSGGQVGALLTQLRQKVAVAH